MTKFYFLIAAIIFAAAFIFVLYVYIEQKKETARIKKEKKEIEENAKTAADKITEANKIKGKARSGNNNNDLLYMANKLHDYQRK